MKNLNFKYYENFDEPKTIRNLYYFIAGMVASQGLSLVMRYLSILPY